MTRQFLPEPARASLLTTGRATVRKLVEPQPPSPDCVGGLTVVLRDIHETGIWYAAYVATKDEHGIEYRPIPQLAGERWYCPNLPRHKYWVPEPWSDCSGSAQPKKHALYRDTYSGPSGTVFSPAITMPQWAARLHVRVASVRVVKDGQWWWEIELERIENANART